MQSLSNDLPISCVNLILGYVSEMNNKKYIPVFEESGKIKWKMNSNLFQPVIKAINHKKANTLKTERITIQNINDELYCPTTDYYSVEMPMYQNKTMKYLWNDSIFIEIVKIETNGILWHGNVYYPTHPQKSERYKNILSIENNIIQIFSTSLIIQNNMENGEAILENNDNLEEMLLPAGHEEDINMDEYNDETFNIDMEYMQMITDTLFML